MQTSLHLIFKTKQLRELNLVILRHSKKGKNPCSWAASSWPFHHCIVSTLTDKPIHAFLLLILKCLLPFCMCWTSPGCSWNINRLWSLSSLFMHTRNPTLENHMALMDTCLISLTMLCHVSAIQWWPYIPWQTLTSLRICVLFLFVSISL